MIYIHDTYKKNEKNDRINSDYIFSLAIQRNVF